MKLTSKGRYAVTAILDIAIYANDGPVSLSDISERQHISLSYLEQLFAKLRRNNLVKSVRGPGGGYKLGYAPNEISIGMVIAAVNENIETTKCLGNADFLNEITLAELVSQHKDRHGKHPHKHHKDFDNLVVVNN